MSPGDLDDADFELAEKDPANSLERRSLRVLDAEIAEMERRLEGLRFVRSTMERHSR